LLAEPVDVDELVVDVIERMTPLANARCIDLTAGRRAHRVVESDRLAILQVLLNMVSNAIKFTPHAGRVTVGCYHSSDDLHFLFRDTGIGIAPEHQERIFEEFYQFRSADPTVPSGSGLGLARAGT
jgi:signal transduction histidine kinase